MRTKFSFGKSLIICVISFFAISAAFTGCGTNYDDDIDDLNARLDSLNAAFNQKITNLENSVSTLTSKVGSLESQVKITSVENINDNNGNKIGIRVNMSDGSRHEIVNGTNGAPGADGSIWEIANDTENPNNPKNGYWIVDGDTTNHKATGTDGKTPPSPYIGTDSCWWIPTWNDDTQTFEGKNSNIKAVGVDSLGAYITEPANENYYLLHVKLDSGGTSWIDPPVKLYKSGAGVSSGIIDIIGYTTYLNPMENLSLSSISTGLADLKVNYWHVTSLTDAKGDAMESWSGTADVVKNNVLISLKGESQVLVVSTNLDASNLKFKIKDSKGNELPIGLGKPIPFNNILTKASGYPLYLIPFTATSATYRDLNAVNSDFRDKFSNSDEIIYYLEDESGVKSNYTSFAIMRGTSPTPIAPVAVKTINENNASSSVFTVYAGEDNKINFDLLESQFVYDYSIVPKDGTTITGFSFDKDKGTFSISRATNDCEIDIYKLHVTGDVYLETIKLKVSP